jgi:putative phosphoribosyl transferase
VPGQRELAAGAVADGSHPVVIFNREILAETGLSEQDLEPVKEEALRELRQREAVLRGGRAPMPVTGKTVIVVDDGLATGSTARAAGLVLRERGAARTLLAVPLAPEDTVEEMRDVYDDVVCLVCPRPFWSVGSHYDDFSQVSDVEVIGMMGG